MQPDHTDTTISPQSAILSITGQILPARCIAIVTELGIPDLIDDQPKDASSLAEHCGVHPLSLFRMMRFLASINIFHQNDDGTFENSPQSEVLRKDVHGSVYPLVRADWQNLVWETYSHLYQGLESGEPAFSIAHGTSFFDYMAKNPKYGDMFDASMALISEPENKAIVATYSLANVQTVMDIGGGQGGLLAAYLKKHNHLRGILFDKTQVMKKPNAVTVAGLEDRYEGIAGDFFDAVPASANVYILKRILHDWNDKDAIIILTKVRQALKSDDRILVVDAIIKPGGSSDPNKYMDLGIMTLLKGRERTAEDFQVLFKAANLKLLRFIPTPSSISIIEGAIA